MDFTLDLSRENTWGGPAKNKFGCNIQEKSVQSGQLKGNNDLLLMTLVNINVYQDL